MISTEKTGSMRKNLIRPENSKQGQREAGSNVLLMVPKKTIFQIFLNRCLAAVAVPEEAEGQRPKGRIGTQN
jgi:hypothetical protein